MSRTWGAKLKMQQGTFYAIAPESMKPCELLTHLRNDDPIWRICGSGVRLARRDDMAVHLFGHTKLKSGVALFFHPNN